MMLSDVHNLALPNFVASCCFDKKEKMKKVALVILACFSIGMTMNAVALEDYVGFSLDSVKSSQNGVNNSSAGLTSMISARPNKYYGWEVQGGILGKIGPFSASGEADFSIAGFVPLGDSGINLYGKGGVDAIYSSGSVFKTGLTYGAGVEYQHGQGIVRLGFQHSNVGKSPSFSTKLIGVTFLVKLGK
jgi:hypothetical protein